MPTWTEARDVFGAALHVAAEAVNGSRTTATSSSSSPVAPVRSVLITGIPGVGKHALVRSAALMSSSSSSLAAGRVTFEEADMATVLAHPKRGGVASLSSSTLPLSSTWRAAAAAAAAAATSTKGIVTAQPPSPLRVVMWSDLHLVIGGGNSDFSADVLEQLCGALRSELPRRGVLVVAILDVAAVPSFSSPSAAAAAASSSGHIVGSSARNFKTSNALMKLLRRVFDLVLDVESPSASVKRRILKECCCGADIMTTTTTTRASATTGREVVMKAAASDSAGTVPSRIRQHRREEEEEDSHDDDDDDDDDVWDAVVGHASVKQLLRQSVARPLIQRDRCLQQQLRNNSGGSSSGGAAAQAALVVAGVAPSLGILMCGVPGTGKTLLARSLAQSMRRRAAGAGKSVKEEEEEESFIALNASSLVCAEVGVSEQNLVGVFASARRKAPSVIFIDEIQAVFRRMDDGVSSQSSPITSTMMPPHERRLVTTLVRCLDENRRMFASGATDAPVVVVGATNVPSLVEPALLRHGRLSQIVHVPPPSVAEVLGMVRKWLLDRYRVDMLNHNNIDVASSSSSSSSSSLVDWFYSTAIPMWCSRSCRDSFCAGAADSAATTTMSRATGADVTGLLNLIELRLRSAKIPAGAWQQRLGGAAVRAASDDVTAAGGSGADQSENAATTAKSLIETVMKRVTPSVDTRTLASITDFVEASQK